MVVLREHTRMEAFREVLWRYVMRLGDCIRASWLLIGDTNQPLESWDKYGGRNISWRKNQTL